MMSEIHEERIEAVRRVVLDCGARTVLDLGCGDGDLLMHLIGEPQIERIVGVDLSREALDRLRARLDTGAKVPSGPRVELIYGSMTETGAALRGFDCAVLLETIEHIDAGRLSLVERELFDVLRPATAVITTPNAELNPWLGVPAHRFRHPDHRFEWGRAKFRTWAHGVAQRHRYHLVCSDIAGVHPVYGGASQMAVFTRTNPCKPGS